MNDGDFNPVLLRQSWGPPIPCRRTFNVTLDYDVPPEIDADGIEDEVIVAIDAIVARRCGKPGT